MVMMGMMVMVEVMVVMVETCVFEEMVRTYEGKRV